MTEEVATRLEMVQPGDTLEDFAERHNANRQDVIHLNEEQLRLESLARGFNPTFERLVPAADGEPADRTSEMGHPCKRVVGWHVHPGQLLRVRDERDTA